MLKSLVLEKVEPLYHYIIVQIGISSEANVLKERDFYLTLYLEAIVTYCLF